MRPQYDSSASVILKCIGGKQYLSMRVDSHKGRGCTHTNVQSHQGHHTTAMNRESRAARLKCSFKGEIWSSFSLPKYVAGTTLQFSDVFRKVCRNATIPEWSCELSTERDWTEEGAHRKETGREEPPRTVIGALSTHREAESKTSHACTTSSCKDAGPSFPLSPAFKISSKVTFHWINLQL